jgi:hypothetical protein
MAITLVNTCPIGAAHQPFENFSLIMVNTASHALGYQQAHWRDPWL